MEAEKISLSYREGARKKSKRNISLTCSDDTDVIYDEHGNQLKSYRDFVTAFANLMKDVASREGQDGKYSVSGRLELKISTDRPEEFFSGD